MSSGSPILDEVIVLFSYIPIALYAAGLRVQEGLVSAICADNAAPAPFTGTINDLFNIWSLRQLRLFNILKGETPYQVLSLRHGNNFPLVNKAVLLKAGCVGKSGPIETDLSLPRSIVMNVSFVLPEKTTAHSGKSSRIMGLLIGIFELSALACSCGLQAWYGIHEGAGLAGCLFISTLCYLILQQFERPVYAHAEAIDKDVKSTVQGGAATDIHVIVPDFNAHEMDVLVGYSSMLHALTNIPVRATRASLLSWICRLLSVILSIQAVLLAKLVGSQLPSLYGSSIWLFSYVAITVIHKVSGQKLSSVSFDNRRASFSKPYQAILPSRRAALSFISSLPMTTPKVDSWDWVDGFMPRNKRREDWQREMDSAKLDQITPPEVNLSDDGRRIVKQVGDVRINEVLKQAIVEYREAVGMHREGHDERHS